MLNINKLKIDEEIGKFNCIIEYPVLKSFRNDLFIDYINKKIYNDILIFKELSFDSFEKDNKNVYSFVDFKTHLNKNNIISISIVFSQLYDSRLILNYVNTYNFDIKREKEILIHDIFCKDEIINNYLDKKFYINDSFISIVFSSYENSDSFGIDEFKLLFNENKENLSRYVKNCIMG